MNEEDHPTEVPSLIDDVVRPRGTTSIQTNQDQIQDWYKIVKQTDIVDELERKLRAEKFDVNTGEWYMPEGVTPMVNNIGIQRIMAIVSSVLDINAVMNDFRPQEIDVMMWELMKEIVLLLRCKHKEFGIDKSMFKTVINLIDRTCYKALNRANMGSTQKFITSTHKQTTTLQQTVDLEGKKSKW